MKDENKYIDHCIIVRDDNGNVIQNPTIEWHYPSGVGAWGREEIAAEPMDPEDIIWLATQRKELLEALEDLRAQIRNSGDWSYSTLRADTAIAKARGER